MSPQEPGGPAASGSSTPSSTLKRGRSVTDLRDRSGDRKRRASTAFSFDGSQPLDSAGAEIDILDLTGPDVDEDATYVARQIVEKRRREQERREAEAANPQPPAPQPGQSAAGPSQIQPHAPEASSSVNGENPFVRGALDPDNVLGARSPARPGASVVPPSLPAPFSLVPRQLPPAGPPRPPQQPMQQLPQAPGILRPNYPPAIPGHSTALPHAFQMPPTGLVVGPVVPQPPRMRGGILSDVIGRTTFFDYVTGVDEFGNPLPDRLLDFLHEDAFGITPAISEKELDDLLNNIRPDLELSNRDLNNTPPGLRMPLYRHQSVALDWMTSMEKGSNKGGILADDMGLGKTVSTIALMLSSKPTSRPKTNLIITPLSLIRQWEEEITKKTRSGHRLSILVYHSKKVDINEMLKYDVVLTTYGTMASEYKRLQDFQEDNKGRMVNFSDSSLRYKFPLLHPGRAKFHRVILDEAQFIKNKKTKTALACQSLTAAHRWCLTGTPMMNGVVELFSLLKFLRIKPYNNWTHFRDAFKPLLKAGHHQHAAMDKLRALLKAVMMRRKKDSMIDGKPILQLPEKTEEVVYVDLSKEERDFYAQLELQSQVQFSKYLRDNSVGENYAEMLVLLLRLRQACCHPHLNLDVKDSLASLVPDAEMMKIVSELDPAIVSRIKELKIFECPICYDYVGCPYFFGQCGHLSCAQCFIRLIDGARDANIQEGEESDVAKCPVCRASFDMKMIFTYEMFQKKYLPESVETGEEDEESADDCKYDWTDSESEADDDTDSEIDEKGNLKDFIDDGDEDADYQNGGDDNDDDDIDDDLDFESKPREKTKTSKKKDKKGKGKGKGKAKKVDIKPSMLKTLRKDASRSQEAYRKYMAYLKQTWLPSAKVSKCIELIQKAAEDGEKIIVFSQWTLLLDLIQVGLKHEKFRGDLRRYDGSMSGEQRFESAREFRDIRKVTAMLVSLRAGNAGLNLTAASRVIIMDPFWNPYVERQAVDRAYRIGQHKKVTVYRILTKDTIEDRIVALKEKKQQMVEAALDEAEGVKISRLDVRQLKFLFGHTAS